MNLAEAKTKCEFAELARAKSDSRILELEALVAGSNQLADAQLKELRAQYDSLETTSKSAQATISTLQEQIREQKLLSEASWIA